MTQLGELKARLAELADLDNIGHLLEWDQNTMMPPNGAQSRSEALATLGRISHELLISDDTGRLLEGAVGELDGAAPDSDDARVVAVTRRRFDKARRVPAELVAEDDPLRPGAEQDAVEGQPVGRRTGQRRISVSHEHLEPDH